MAGDTPENHSATCRYLAVIRDIRAEVKKRNHPANVLDSFKEIVKITDPSRTAPKQGLSLAIVGVLSESFDNELDFDKKLFKAFEKDLTKHGVKVDNGNSNNENIIVLEKSISGEWAFGFARQAKGREMEMFRKKKAKTVSEDARSEYDHVCCLFRKETASNGEYEWKVEECFSVVELKTSNISSKIRWDETKEMINLLEDDPIVQELEYVLESTWRSICRCGLGSLVSGDNDALPVALIAAQKTGEPLEPQKARWLKASILVPRACGDSFCVQLNGTEGFAMTQRKRDERGVKKAAGLYAETMLFGLILCDKMKERNYKQVPPSSLSGQKLFFDETELENSELCGSPLLDKMEGEKIGFFDDSQGELYRLPSLPAMEVESATWLCDPNNGNFTDLLVKVWSRNVHDCLQPIGFFSSAVTEVILKDPKLTQELSSVLLAVQATETGTLTLMREINGTPLHLREEDDPSKIVEYWTDFEELVRTVLLPLAAIGILYQDLRPGFDLTANVLRVRSDDNRQKMRLIDLESLCKVIHSNLTDPRYPVVPRGTPKKTRPYVFLHSQCAGIAYAWIKEVDAENFDMATAVDWVRKKRNVQVSTSAQEIQSLLEWVKGEVRKQAAKKAKNKNKKNQGKKAGGNKRAKRRKRYYVDKT